MKLIKSDANPILSPNPQNDWESLCVCNPGAWYQDGVFSLLYRAAGDDASHVIHLGLAESRDGVHFTRVSDRPVFSPSSDSFDSGCVEDPRIVRFDDSYYVTYAFRPFPPGRYWERKGRPDAARADMGEDAPLCLRKNLANSGLAVTKDFRSFRRLGRITQSNLDDRDVILFPERIGGRFAMLHRPKEWVGDAYGTDYPAIWIRFSDDLMEWGESTLLMKGTTGWERKIGGSTPPLKTEKGWLMLYHAVDEAGIYRVGAVLLDLNDPTKILARTHSFLMEPEHPYEFEGLYHGCVFPTGNVIVGDTLYVYYGGADMYCCLATCSVQALLDHLRAEG